MGFYKNVYVCCPDVRANAPVFNEMCVYLKEYGIPYGTPVPADIDQTQPYIAVCVVSDKARQAAQWKEYAARFAQAGNNAAVILYCPEDLPAPIGKNPVLGSAPCAKTAANCAALVKKTFSRTSPLVQARTASAEEEHARQIKRIEKEKAQLEQERDALAGKVTQLEADRTKALAQAQEIAAQPRGSTNSPRRSTRGRRSLQSKKTDSQD